MLPLFKNPQIGKTMALNIGASNIESDNLKTRTGITQPYIKLNLANVNTENDNPGAPDVDMNLTCKGAGSVKLMGCTLSLEENKMLGSSQIDQGSNNAYEIQNSGYVPGDIVIVTQDPVNNSDQKAVDPVLRVVWDSVNSNTAGVIILQTISNTGVTGSPPTANLPFTWMVIKKH
jgi:hypothetical protein